MQFWTQEQIEAAILTYGADDIDCCIQNQGEHIIRLQAELTAAQKERNAIVALLNSEVHETRAELEAAQAEIAALRENAERYRRVKRDHEIPWNIDVPDTIAGRFYVMYGGDPVGCLEGELDAAIDAARKAK